MYDYKLEKNEYIMFESSYLIVEHNDIKKECAIIITNYNLILLEDVNKDSIINKTLVGLELPKYSKMLEFNKNKMEAFYNGTSTKLNIGDYEIYVYNVDLVPYI